MLFIILRARYTKDMYKTYTPFEGGYLVTNERIRLVIFLIQVKQLLNQDVIQA